MISPPLLGAVMALALPLVAALAQTPNPAPAKPAAAAALPGYVELKREAFQREIDGQAVDLFTIRNHHGMLVRITNLGARIEQILVPDRAGRLGDVALGFDSLDGVLKGRPYIGVFVGRYANRIAKGQFTLDGHAYQVSVNDGPNSMHGGVKGSRTQVFTAHQLSEDAVEMTHVFRDGEEGFPGTLPVRVVYRVGEDNRLTISWASVAVDKATVASFTGHTFFNLSGRLDSTVLDQVMMINADKVLEIDDTLIPTGRLREVGGTPMDFRKPKAIGKEIGADYDLLKLAHGYDNTWVINKPAGSVGLDARIFDPQSGRVMEVWSTEPSLQMFSGNTLNRQAPMDLGKGGVLFPHNGAFAVEPARYPDAPNKPSFPSARVGAAEWFTGEIEYRFSVRR
jgi:aldose 1-epimerase